MSDRQVAPPSAFDLASRPGFLIRRLHQIHTALFIEECAEFSITPVQYSVMTMAEEQPGLEQARLGHEVGVDRTTLANVVARPAAADDDAYGPPSETSFPDGTRQEAAWTDGACRPPGACADD